MNEIQNIIILLSLFFNLIGVHLTVGSKLTSKHFKIDSGTFSDLNSGSIEIDLGKKYIVGSISLGIGVALQILVTAWLLFKNSLG